MRFRLLATIALLTITGLAVTTNAQSGSRGKLSVGDEAPSINVETWVKGTFDPSSAEVYVIEFWATWCGPCKKSIPHLTALQEEYADDGLVIVGISTDKETGLVEGFVKRQGMKMNYVVGIDNRNRTERSWMKAAGLSGIPAAFIVDKNNIIQFIGNPLDETFDEVLHNVMSGRYDLKKSVKAQPSIDNARKYRDLNSWAEAVKYYEDALSVDNYVFAELYKELFEMKLLDQGDTAGAYKLLSEVSLARGSEDPELLTWLAKMIATDSRIKGEQRRMDVAMKLAQTALTFARKKTDPKYISTIALIHFEDGRFDDAIEWQRKAYFSAKEKEKADYKFTLDSYRSQQQRASASE
jgi:thiol-disulfide isomerase/thioredoxin